MIFKNRLIRTKGGGVEIRLSFFFERDEVDNVPRIADDPNVSLDTLGRGGPEPESRVDWYLTWLRIWCHWCGLWKDRDKHKSLLLSSRERRKTAEFKKGRKKR